MLLVDEHTNLRLSILYLSALVIEALKDQKMMEYDRLLSRVTKESHPGAREILPYALSFLFMLGKIEYLPDLDSIKQTI